LGLWPASLWRQTRNQVFQDDVRERKEEKGKGIHQEKRNFLLPTFASFFSFFMKKEAKDCNVKLLQPFAKFREHRDFIFPA